MEKKPKKSDLQRARERIHKELLKRSPAHGARSYASARDQSHRDAVEARGNEGSPATRTIGRRAHRGGSAVSLGQPSSHFVRF
jgi:hypothetical protein